MNILRFASEVFSRFPKWFLFSILLLIIQGIFAGFSVLSIAPIVDLFLHPDLKGMSPLTLKLIEQFESVGLPTSIVTFVTLFIFTLLLKNVFFMMIRYVLLVIKYLVLRALIKETFQVFFRARWAFFSSSDEGTILNTFMKEVMRTGDAFGQLGLLISNGSQILIFLIVPLLIAWEATLICLTLAVLLAAPLLLIGKLSYRLGREHVRTSNLMVGVLKENLMAAKIILGFGEQKRSIQWHLDAFDAHRVVTVNAQVLDDGIRRFYEPLGMIALVSTLFLTREISISIAETAVVIWGLKSILPLVGETTASRNSLQGLMPSYEQVKHLKQEAKQWECPSGEKNFSQLQDALTFKNVCFTYPNRNRTLHKINLNISKGKMTAIVGGSGAGKSTMIDLLLGLNFPEEGTILLDDVPLSEYDVESYRQRVGYVPQDAILFNRSVRDNLLFANPKATEEELWKACSRANAIEFVQQLPEQLETIIGDRGVRLSGGQCQRISLARALVRKPELLILDEATSALDTKAEQLIQEAIDQIAGETTIVVVAHRLSTIANADYVYVLQEGRITEEGEYTELLARQGIFFEMVKTQQLPESI